MNSITVNLTDKEAAALRRLSEKTDLSQERVLIQGLRLYELQMAGKVQVINDGPPKAMPAEQPASEAKEAEPKDDSIPWTEPKVVGRLICLPEDKFNEQRDRIAELERQLTEAKATLTEALGICDITTSIDRICEVIRGRMEFADTLKRERDEWRDKYKAIFNDHQDARRRAEAERDELRQENERLLQENTALEDDNQLAAMLSTQLAVLEMPVFNTSISVVGRITKICQEYKRLEKEIERLRGEAAKIKNDVNKAAENGERVRFG